MERKFICSSTEPVVQTKAGKLRGFYLDGTYTFHGIKYAEAERFKMPRPVKVWEGVKDALCYGYVAPLAHHGPPSDDLLIPHRFWPENEHCQYLNIWTQSLDRSAKKPVMIWLHGGGFAAGSSIEMVAYDGDNLSRFGEVVVISLNHRLNILGYLDLSDFGEQYYNSGNAGMADIVEALKWVQENVAAFGGDPDNVTIFGQSGGGAKVTTLCQIPEASGLFHKAIVMSGVFDLSFGAERNDRLIVEALLEELNINQGEVNKLEEVPFPDLAKAYRRISKSMQEKNIQTFNGPLPNDWYLGDPMKIGFSEHAKKIPTMAGTVIAEFSFGRGILHKNKLSLEERRELLSEKFGDMTDDLISIFRKTYPGKNEIDLLEIDSFFRLPTLKYMEQKSAVADAPVYSYMFALDFAYDDGKPAWHCADIPFVFHNTDKIAICNIAGVTDQLEEQVSSAYVNFARNGNPNHQALPYWPEFKPNNKATMVFDTESEVRIDYERELMDLLAKFPPEKIPMPVYDED